MDKKDKTMLEFNTKEYLLQDAEKTLFEVQAMKCDPNTIKYLTFSNDYVFFPVSFLIYGFLTVNNRKFQLRNRDKDVLNCDDYNIGRKLYTFRYQCVLSASIFP